MVPSGGTRVLLLAVALVILLIAWSERVTDEPPPFATDEAPSTLAALSGLEAATSTGQELAANGSPGTRILAGPDSQSEVRKDIEWSEVLRSRREVVRVIVVSPRDARATELLRSADFNPRDVYLRRSQRLAVGEAIASMESQVASAAAEYEAAADREFELARSSSLAVAIDLARFRGSLQLRPLGQDPYFRVIDNVTWGIARKDMPDTFTARGHLRRTGAQLVERIAAAFVNAGALTTDEAGALQARARQLANDEPHAGPR